MCGEEPKPRGEKPKKREKAKREQQGRREGRTRAAESDVNPEAKSLQARDQGDNDRKQRARGAKRGGAT